MGKKYYVIPFDLVNVIWTTPTRTEYEMYCEIGGGEIDPDGPITFTLKITNDRSLISLMTTDLEVLDYDINSEDIEKCIDEFLVSSLESFRKGEWTLPPNWSTSVGDDVDITSKCLT